MFRRLAALLPLTLIAAAGLAACGSADGASGEQDGRLAVVTSFYPLQLAAQQIGGDHVHVVDLTKPGIEPHDLELTPKDVAKISKASIFIYEKGISGAVDTAAANEAAKTGFDVSPAADLSLRLTSPVADTGHADRGHGEEQAGSVDPHFWLDPVRYQSVARAIAERLSSTDPAHRTDYQRNAQSFEGRLSTLNTELVTGLKSCTHQQLVTSHAAFGYLAERTGLTQVPIAGLSPDVEPEASQLGRIATYAKQHHVTTIYTETLASPAFADTIAHSVGASTAVLDPLEGITNASPGKDYFSVMRANIATLKKGQGCS